MSTLGKILFPQMNLTGKKILSDHQANEVLTRLARDPYLNIRLQIAQTSSTPKEVLEILTQDSEEIVRGAARQELSGSKARIIRMLKDN
jgi:hypothetical protein